MLHVHDGHIFTLGCSKSPFFLLHSNADKPYAKQKLMKTALDIIKMDIEIMDIIK